MQFENKKVKIKRIAGVIAIAYCSFACLLRRRKAWKIDIRNYTSTCANTATNPVTAAFK